MLPDNLTLPHDIGSPEEYLPGTPLWIWLVIGFIVLSILWAVFFFLSRRKKIVQAKNFDSDQYTIAAQRLEKLKEQGDKIPIGQVATATSLVLRECLAHVLNDPALYETDEEIAIRLASLDRVPPSVRSFLLDLSGEKYAPSKNIDEVKALRFTEQAAEVLLEVRQSQLSPQES